MCHQNYVGLFISIEKHTTISIQKHTISLKWQWLQILFLDLKNSTDIAERLGHTKYSLFLKDCFSDLTNPIYNSDANVYQYVGDEVILIWNLKHGLRNLNCFKLFFDYKKRLCKRVNKTLLFTEYLDVELPSDFQYKKDFVGEFNLEGKDHPVKVFSMEELLNETLHQDLLK